MGERIIIEPVTRIEGHAKITIQLDETGRVADAHFHVAEFRGFERIAQGRPMWEMAGITSRICGICPVSHLLASVKACDQILSVAIPRPAEKLRRLMNLAQMVQSHALSFFHLSSPDLLLGMDAEPARRNVFALAALEPELVRGGIRLRQFGQRIIEALGGKRIHPAWAVPGGVRSPLSAENRDAIKQSLPDARATTLTALSRFKGLLSRFREEAEHFGNFPSLFMSLVAEDGSWEHYGGQIRFVNSEGQIVADGLDPARYRDYIGEATESWSYLKSPYYRSLGYPDGIYRVGPLARLWACSRLGTPHADQEFAEFRSLGNGPLCSSFFYHYARLLEILTSLERIDEALDDADLASEDLRAEAGVNRLEGVGCSEAPRGTLFHHYRVDRNGLIEKVNLLIATGQNNLAMNRAVLQAARHYIQSPKIPEGILNRLEASIRAFDPCLSCSTHAAGQMPLVVQLLAPDGSVLDEIHRE
jgi:NAD-reducing hydrogenase large subunit